MYSHTSSYKMQIQTALNLIENRDINESLGRLWSELNAKTSYNYGKFGNFNPRAIVNTARV